MIVYFGEETHYKLPGSPHPSLLQRLPEQQLEHELSGPEDVTLKHV